MCVCVCVCVLLGRLDSLVAHGALVRLVARVLADVDLHGAGGAEALPAEATLMRLLLVLKHGNASSNKGAVPASRPPGHRPNPHCGQIPLMLLAMHSV